MEKIKELKSELKSEFKIGSFCRSIAGHDFGSIYIIVEVDQCIKVADGKYKCIDKPKVKNPRHIELLDYEDEQIQNKLSAGKLKDTDLKYSIKNYLKSHQ